MITQLFHTLFCLVFTFLFIIPGIHLPDRISSFFLFLFLILISYFLLKINRKKSYPCEWISKSDIKTFPFLTGLLFLITGFISLLVIPLPGISFHFNNELIGKEHHVKINTNHFHIIPARFNTLHVITSGEFELSCQFTLNEPVSSFMFYVSHGDALWTINGEEFAHHPLVTSDRYLVIQKELPPGVHTIHCSISQGSPIPEISCSIRTYGDNEHRLLEGPFYKETVIFWDKYFVLRNLPSFLFILSFFCLIPILNHFLRRLSLYFEKYCTLVSMVGWSVVLCLFVVLKYNTMQITFQSFEADEAAFGIMSQELNKGHCPPLFHYGQNYQGTLESIPLSIFLGIFPSNVVGLKMLPFLWFSLFIFITTFSFYLFGGAYLALFSLFFFTLGGTHFYWIMGKAWFGYSFTLLCGSILFLISARCYQLKRVSPGYALLWGMIAGIGFYQLPLILPFILVSFLILLFAREKTFSPFYYNDYNQYLAYLKSGPVLVILFFILFCAPYWITWLISQDSGSFDYLVKGRSLPSARVEGEREVLDRFLGECLPTILGLRAPYDQQNELPSVLFPYFPPLIVLLSVIFYPFLRKRIHLKQFMIKKPIYYFFFFLFLFTLLIVSYSMFGIWPWYALPMYFCIPVILFVFFKFLSSYSPSLFIVIFFIFFLSLSSSFLSYSKFFHQPTSLSRDGLYLPSAYDEIADLLLKNNIRYVLCDQGFDVSPDYAGRDWLGENVLFTSEGSVISIDRLSRRLPHYSQELIKNNRVAYLFHEDYWYNNPTLEKLNTNEYNPLYIRKIDKLFSNAYLYYNKYNISDYILFIPKKYHQFIDKTKFSIDSNTFWFTSASYDKNISVRAYGRETYWSSEKIPKSGSYFTLSLDKSRFVQRIILFHGTKTSDYPRRNQVFAIDDKGNRKAIGPFIYKEEINSSVLEMEKPILTHSIEIVVQPDKGNNWWTIFELWVL